MEVVEGDWREFGGDAILIGAELDQAEHGEGCESGGESEWAFEGQKGDGAGEQDDVEHGAEAEDD